jgi:hypothetical protein
VYNEGDEIVCVQHLHKQWHVTCNDLSEARDARRRVHLAKLGQEMRDEIIQQAAKQVEDPANKYYHGKQGALIKQSTGLEGLDLGFRDRKAREAKAATAKNSGATGARGEDVRRRKVDDGKIDGFRGHRHQGEDDVGDRAVHEVVISRERRGEGCGVSVVGLPKHAF